VQLQRAKFSCSAKAADTFQQLNFLTNSAVVTLNILADSWHDQKFSEFYFSGGLGLCTGREENG